MTEVLYHFLGAVLAWRRALVALTAAVVVVLWLLQVQAAAQSPTPERLFGLAAMPLLLGVAAVWLFRLPPGVVFRPTTVLPRAAPNATARCFASGYFTTARHARWRLLARSSLSLDAAGALHLVCPPPLLGPADSVAHAFPERGPPLSRDLGAREPLRYPEWVYQPQALGGEVSRGLYRSAADYAAEVGALTIVRADLDEVTVGWQYARLRRWPAVRLLHHHADGTLEAAYLAFAHEGQLAWLLARLGGG